MTDKVEKARRPVGRPRSEKAKRAILHTAYQLLLSRPVERITIGEIATAASVSTATIYRWWKTKEAVIIDAFLAEAAPRSDFKPVGTPLECLREQLVRGTVFNHSREGKIFLNFVLRAALDAPLEQAMQNEDVLREFNSRHRDASLSLIRRAIAVGELPPAAPPDLIFDLLNGAIFIRAMLGDNESLDERFAEETFDTVIAGVRLRYMETTAR